MIYDISLKNFEVKIYYKINFRKKQQNFFQRQNLFPRLLLNSKNEISTLRADRRNKLVPINKLTGAKEAYSPDFRQFHANRILD